VSPPAPAPAGLGVALTWHRLPWEELLALVLRAEELGYRAAFVDGDIATLDSDSERNVLDGWTVTTALLAHTRRIQIGSIRLVHHWNAARLAQAVATAERIAPGRLRFLLAIGDRLEGGSFGLPRLPARERIRWLDETATALRRLWSGEVVTLRGRYVQLAGARIRPTPPDGHIPIAIAARRPRMLEQVALHADCWEVNLPPVSRRVERAAGQLAATCRRIGRDPDTIARSLWVFTRVDPALDAAAVLPEFRRWNPWFASIPDEELRSAVAVGSADQCRRKLAELRDALRLDLPVVDLSGLAAGPARNALEALAPPRREFDATI
jgi:alkanesulfonate monooxygenase SsuD/methylene tetrahydromethanopterin reductase-like flavin-dependent oxidoreductase (luciferase family)